MSKVADRLIELVSSVERINATNPPCPTCHHVGYGEEGHKRKALFLQLAALVLHELRIELGIFDRKAVKVNEAGPAVSGDAILEGEWFRIILSKNHGPEWGDFFFSYRISPSEWKMGEWCTWESLRDIPKLAKRIKELRPSL